MNLTLLRRWWPLAGVAVLLALAALVAPHGSLGINRVKPPVEDLPGQPEYPPSPSFAAQSREVPASHQTNPPDWLGALAAALCVIAVAAVVGLLVFALIRDILRRRTRPVSATETRPAPAPAAEEVVAALDAGLVDLSDADADPRRAVIACWVRLEQAAAAAGIPRRIGDTPTDLVTRLLTGHSASPAAEGVRPGVVSGDVLAVFAQVYREARYATHTVDERMRTEARSALQRLRAELTAGAPA